MTQPPLYALFQPLHHVVHGSQNRAIRHGRSVNHDDWQAQRTRGVQLCLGPRSPCVFGHNMGDGMVPHQGGVTCHIKRAARQNDCVVRQRERCLRRIDQTQQKVMFGTRGESVEVLLANRQKHACGVMRQRINSARYVTDTDPVIAIIHRPRRALERGKADASLCTGRHSVRAYLRGKGVGGIDDMGDGFVLQVFDQTSNASEPANPRLKGLRNRTQRPARIGKNCIHTAFCQSAGKARSLCRAAEQKDACHG